MMLMTKHEGWVLLMMPAVMLMLLSTMMNS
jgi:hypothetical protein